MRIAIASAHRGFGLKEAASCELRSQHEVIDLGSRNSVPCDYPEFAAAVARAVCLKQADRGILFGGNGIGMSIVANRFPTVRAVICHDTLSAELSRRQYDANVLCVPADLLSEELAITMIQLWLTAPFDEGRHARRILKIAEIEKMIRENTGRT